MLFERNFFFFFKRNYQIEMPAVDAVAQMDAHCSQLVQSAAIIGERQ